METTAIIPFASTIHAFPENEFENAFYSSRLRYSLRQVELIGGISQKKTMDAIRKSLQVCHMLGINSKHHFKKIFVFDPDSGVMHTQWLMSKSGLNLMVMQIASLSEKRARWLWQLANS